jgi:peptidyl-prolyl cis-trans isomerase D
MPSREFRRAMRRKEQSQGNIVEKKRERHPLIYGFSLLILVVIVVTFIGTPAVRSRFGAGGGGKIVFGYYRGHPIEYYPGNYLSERKDVLAEQIRQSGQKEDIELQAYQVWRTAFDQTVAHTAMLLQAENSGAWVSGDAVDKALIASGPWTQNGVFNEDRYRATSNQEKYAYRKLFREQLLDEQFQRDLFLNQRFSHQEIDFFKSMVAEQRQFSFISLPFLGYPDAELKAYGEKNADKFRRIKLSQILIKSSESEALEIRKKLEDRTSSFEELARAHSKDAYAEKGGEVGWRYFYDLEGDFEDKKPLEGVMSLEEGAYSPVLKSRFGWVIYRCDSPALQPDFSLPETLQVVRDYAIRYEKGMIEDYFVKKADAFIARTKDVGFLGAALSQNLTTYETEFFPLNYQSFYFLAPVKAKGDKVNLSSASYNEDFFKKAFALAPGGVSAPVLLDDQVVVLRLDEVRKPPQSELDLMDRYYAYFAQQTLQADLQNALLKPEYIKDDFNQAFYTYVFPKQQ